MNVEDDTNLRTDPASSMRHWTLASPLVAVVAIWVSSALVAVLAPDMITGSQHEHLPIGALTVWLWAAVATGYVLMAAGAERVAPGLVATTSAVWATVVVVAVFAPSMVTGTDPTTIPIGVLVAPVAGAVATGFVALHHRIR